MGMMQRIAAVLALGVALAAAEASAQTTWTGPEEIFAADFGSGPTQVGLNAGSVAEYDEFPDTILVADDGTLLLPDPVNRRMVMVASGGAVSRFGPRDLGGVPETGWPGRELAPLGARIVVKTGSLLQIYGRDGSVAAARAGVDGEFVGVTSDGRIVLRRGGDPPIWDVFNDHLERAVSTTTEPTLAGAVSIERVPRLDPEHLERRAHLDLVLRAGGPEVRVRDVDGDVSAASAARDGSFYLVQPTIDRDRSYRIEMPDGPAARLPIPRDAVVHIGADGSLTGRVDLLASEFDTSYVLDGVEDAQPRRIVGGTTVDRDGNVYVFQRDATRYRVLKWTRR